MVGWYDYLYGYTGNDIVEGSTDHRVCKPMIMHKKDVSNGNVVFGQNTPLLPFRVL